MSHILVLGATGYVGGRLVPALLREGHSVRCLARDRRKLKGKAWHDRVKVVEGDILQPASLPKAFEGIDIVYHLVHSMSAGEGNFEDLDRRAAANVAAVSEKAGLKRIIYLGGLGRRHPDQSPHLRSRHEVGDVLRQGSVPVTEFRAAVIVGSGSLSFEMMHHLTNRLPVMVCPRWVFTRTQPIAIRDILAYLTAAVRTPESSGKVIDIGGPEVITYRDMMLRLADILGLKRFLIQVPVLTPRLSSYWVNLVTPIPAQIARALIEGLRHETICENDLARQIFDIEPTNFDKAVRLALAKVTSHEIETMWTGANSMRNAPEIDPSHLRIDRRRVAVGVPADRLFREVASIGGENGWYYADWLWKLRGFIDKMTGGVGLRRGRRHPKITSPGEALDFWRVEEYIEGEKMILRAEMKVWGQAWLEFEVMSGDGNSATLIQTARFYPRGLWGLVYWYSVYPLHAIVFRGLIQAIARRACEGDLSLIES